jgi:hypothetical protein
MINPFLLPPAQLRQTWKNLRNSIDQSMPVIDILQTVSKFWNLAPTSKPYLDYLDPETWPDPWTLLDSKNLDVNSISLGVFYTLLHCNDTRIANANLKLVMMRQPMVSWEGLVCIVDDQWVIGYDTGKLVDIASIPDMLCMHTYKYDLQKRRVVEITKPMVALQHA